MRWAATARDSFFYNTGTQSYSVGSTRGAWSKENLEFTVRSSDDFVLALKERKFPLWEQELQINPGLEYLRALSEPFFTRTGTSVAVPFIQEESVVGILCLGGRASDSLYGTEDLRFLSTLANVAASSIAVALNYREIERQLSIQTFLFVLSESLVRYAGSEEAIRSAIGVLQSFLDLEECFVLTPTGEGQFRVHAARDIAPLQETQLALVARALAAGKGRQSDDAAFSGALTAATVDLPGSEPESSMVRSLLYLPLVSGGEWIGIIALSRRRAEGSENDSAAVSGAFKAILSQGLIAIRHVSELRALKEYNEKVLVSVSTSGEMLLVVDAAGTILRTNSATTDLLGFGRGEIVGMSLRQLVEAGSSAGVVESFLRSSALHVVQGSEMQFRDQVRAGVSPSWFPARTSSTRRTRRRKSSSSPVTSPSCAMPSGGSRNRSGGTAPCSKSVLDAVVTFRDDGELIDVNPRRQPVVRARRRAVTGTSRAISHRRGPFRGPPGRACGARQHQGLRAAAAQARRGDADRAVHRQRWTRGPRGTAR